MDTPFYADGLRWSCARCSACCRYESGYLFLSKNDLAALAREFDLSEGRFIQIYCRWVHVSFDLEYLSLKETSHNDCFFWKDGCSVYHARPTQCRTYPFWKNHLTSKTVWEQTAASCPGVGQGALCSQTFIASCIAAEDAELLLARRIP